MELDLQDVLGRGDFVGGIDNEALDFSQLEAFINSEGPQSGATYFTDSLNSTATPSGGKLLNVENKRQPGHSLPESPPDSSSEHPYSPQDNCEQPINPPDAIYTQLGSHIVVTDQSDANILNERILVGDNLLHPHAANFIVQANGDPATKTTDGTALVLDFDPSTDHALETVYTSLQNASKKRKLSQDLAPVKSEPAKEDQGQLSPPGNLSASMDDDYAASEGCLSESQYQCIRFCAFQQTAWHSLCDQNLTELPIPHYRVDADKGFNFSNADDAFVCQKKNHFQITCHIQLVGDAQFVKTPEGFQKISSFHIHFYGVKHDCPTQTIRVEQSQSDRSKKPFHPVLVELVSSQVTKITVGRLHFSETTSNNMRKKGKPNPEQRYFQLVVGLHAHTSHGNFPIVSHASQKIIVRASNPGQFENDVELCWQKGQVPESIYHAGKVGINTDRPDESLVIHGNLKITGHIIQPSDVRAKKNIVECDTREQLRNVQKLRVVRYQYEPDFAKQLNRPCVTSDTGVIAQEVAQVLPEAVTPAGDFLLRNGTSIDNFLVVNKERIFMENIGAVKELCKVTDNLETRIDQLERINKRLSKLKRGDSVKSTSTVGSVKHVHSAKCMRNHYQNEEELCTNKFIQIVIVILVFIMAFCLAAITGLYLMEASRHSHTFSQMSLKTSHHLPSTKRPNKNSKLYNWSNVYTSQTNGMYKDSILMRSPIDISSFIKGPSDIIGRPSNCLMLERNLDVQLCPTFCCIQTSLEESPQEIESTVYNERSKSNPNHTNHLGLEINKEVKSFHTNKIDKQLRQRRDTDDWTKRDNIFHSMEDSMVTVSLQGRYFNTTLTNHYMIHNNNGNISYIVPISKFMPDRFIYLIFKSLQPNVKEIEHCYNEYRQQDCPFTTTIHSGKRYKVNENQPNLQASSQSVAFEVDMIGFHFKVMTYRASLRQSQNTCKLSTTKLGLEFIEYNFYFLRHCDE